jgi:hypothetical protein
VTSKSANRQAFHGSFGLNVTCERVAGKGLSLLESERQKMEVTYTECTGGKPANPVDYKFFANGEVEIEKAVEIKETFCGRRRVALPTVP